MSLYNKIIDLQKLNMAWKRVKANRPSPGVDGVTWDVYDASASEENKRLHKELAEKAYECKPVKNVTLYILVILGNFIINSFLRLNLACPHSMLKEAIARLLKGLEAYKG